MAARGEARNRRPSEPSGGDRQTNKRADIDEQPVARGELVMLRSLVAVA
jgi:hypothetical protein